MVFSDPVRYTARCVRHLVYPVRCVECSMPLFGQLLPACPVCLSRLERVEESCLRQHLPHTGDASMDFSMCYAHWFFDKQGVVQFLHHRLKYGNRPAYGRELGHLCGHGMKRILPDPLPELLVPVPLHPVRFLERGYNQSAMLAEGMNRATSIPVAEKILERPRATRSQTGLSIEERTHNVLGAFSIPHPDRVTGRHVVLVDDILTTGATLGAAAHCMAAAGAAQISLAVLGFARP